MNIVINRDRQDLPAGAELINGYHDYWLNILAATDMDSPCPPAGAFLSRCHGLEGTWIVASPIQWEATHNDAMIVAAGKELALDNDESKRLFHAFAEFTRDDNFQPVYHSANLWLICVDGRAPIQSPRPESIVHQSLMPLLAEMDKTLYWQRLFTEVQMFFNASVPDSLINGLWFWGAGALASMPVSTDDAALLELNLPGVRALSSGSVAEKNQTLVLSNPSEDELNYYIKQTQTQNTQWFWTNLAYQSQAKRWWRTLFYAN